MLTLWPSKHNTFYMEGLSNADADDIIMQAKKTDPVGCILVCKSGKKVQLDWDGWHWIHAKREGNPKELLIRQGHELR